MNRIAFPTFTVFVLALLLAGAGSAVAGNEILGELQLRAGTAVEKRAGVWIDGQYLGYLEELKGSRKVLLLPGEHQLTLTLAGYKKAESTIQIKPGDKKLFKVTMTPDPQATYADKAETGQVQISIKPERAAVFVNDHYAGHVDAFNGYSGLRLSEGRHRFRIALPGYEPFETELTVRAGQHYQIKTELVENADALVWTGQERDGEVEDAE